MPKEKSNTIGNQAYDCLFQKILYCELAPGQEIKEKELMEETGFGRTPLHEALLLLQKDGLVDIYPRHGMRVSDLTTKQILDLSQARKLIEPAIATEYRRMYSKQKLLDFRDRFLKTIDMIDLDRFYLDMDFHMYLVSIAGNYIISDIYHNLMLLQIRLGMFALFKHVRSAREDDLKQHLAIIDALFSENATDIQNELITHLNYSQVRSLQAVADDTDK